MVKAEFVPFHQLDAMRRQLQDEQPSISHQAIVSRRSDCYSIIKKGRVFDRIALETLSQEFEHGECDRWR